ncbi:tyrosine-type recombinase/integrase [Neobacillus pocheonensis]|uniref:tyrosine-type recombinase/integrase n=1 Tax=Neobacillus pocheonensis TaxID=363869 RepID=UPI003D2C5CCF
MENFKKWMRAEGKSDHTIRRYIRIADDFQEWFMKITNQTTFDPKLVTALDLQDWRNYLIHEATYQRKKEEEIQELRYSISSINNCIKGIRAFFAFYIDAEVIKKNPAAKLRTLKVQNDIEEEPRWLERIEKNRLLAYINDEGLKEKNPWRFTRNRAIVYCGLHMGLRASEIADAEIEDADFESGFFYVRDGKGGKAAKLPMNLDLRNALLEWIEERNKKDPRSKKLFTSQKRQNSLTERAIDHIYRTISKQTGIKNLTSHVPRHTFGHDLIERGRPLNQVADAMRHANVNTTRKYTKSSNRELKNSLDSLSGERDM